MTKILTFKRPEIERVLDQECASAEANCSSRITLVAGPRPVIRFLVPQQRGVDVRSRIDICDLAVLVVDQNPRMIVAVVVAVDFGQVRLADPCSHGHEHFVDFLLGHPDLDLTCVDCLVSRRVLFGWRTPDATLLWLFALVLASTPAATTGRVACLFFACLFLDLCLTCSLPFFKFVVVQEGINEDRDDGRQQEQHNDRDGDSSILLGCFQWHGLGLLPWNRWWFAHGVSLVARAASRKLTALSAVNTHIPASELATAALHAATLGQWGESADGLAPEHPGVDQCCGVSCGASTDHPAIPKVDARAHRRCGGQPCHQSTKSHLWPDRAQDLLSLVATGGPYRKPCARQECHAHDDEGRSRCDLSLLFLDGHVGRRFERGVFGTGSFTSHMRQNDRRSGCGLADRGRWQGERQRHDRAPFFPRRQSTLRVQGRRFCSYVSLPAGIRKGQVASIGRTGL